MTLTLQSQAKSFSGVQRVYTHHAETTQCDMEFSIYLPEESDKKLPILYYFSGLTCTQDNVTIKSGFQQYASEAGFIVVCPDTSPRGNDYPGEHDDYDFGSGAGFYLNATQSPWSQNYKMYDYVVKELPELVNKNFAVDTSRCGVFGHSMGGHGALITGLKNPDLFQSISAFSPIVAPMQSPWGQKAFQGYLGENKDTWKEYDATELIKSGYKSKNSILIDQGTSDSFLKPELKPELFQQACEENGQALELRMQLGYDHSYFFIASFIREHFLFHQQNLLG